MKRLSLVCFILLAILCPRFVIAAGPPDVGYYQRPDCTTLNGVAYGTTCLNTGSGGTLLQGAYYVWSGTAWIGPYPSFTEDATNLNFNKPPIFGNCATNCLTEDFSAVTGAKTLYYPNHTGYVPTSPNARKVVQVELVDATTDVTTGNGKAYFRVPSNLAGMNLVAVKSNVVTAGTTGLTSVQITRCAAATSGNICSGTTASMLTTVVSIDSGENSSSDAASAVAIDTSNDDVADGQILRFDVTAVQTTASKGLVVSLEFELP